MSHVEGVINLEIKIRQTRKRQPQLCELNNYQEKVMKKSAFCEQVLKFEAEALKPRYLQAFALFLKR